MLPPGLVGYRRYITLHARSSDRRRWAAPDLGRARRLVAASRVFALGDLKKLLEDVAGRPSRRAVAAMLRCL
jgi:hypothetical protein